MKLKDSNIEDSLYNKGPIRPSRKYTSNTVTIDIDTSNLINEKLMMSKLN